MSMNFLLFIDFCSNFLQVLSSFKYIYINHSLFVLRSNNFPLYSTELAFRVLLMACDKFSLLDELGEWGEWSIEEDEEDDDERDDDFVDTCCCCCCWLEFAFMLDSWVWEGSLEEEGGGGGGGKTLDEFLLLLLFIEFGGLGVFFDAGNGGCVCCT